VDIAVDSDLEHRHECESKYQCGYNYRLLCWFLSGWQLLKGNKLNKGRFILASGFKPLVRQIITATRSGGGQAPVAHACNPACSGGIDQEEEIRRITL
jgi:hypothetical protein